MRFSLSSVLATAALASAASISHHHKHTHAHQVEKRDLTSWMESVIGSVGGTCGSNPTTLGGSNAASLQGESDYQFEFVNSSGEDMVLVFWYGDGQAGSYNSQSLKSSTPPVITQPIANGHRQMVYLDPTCMANNSMSGGFSALYEGYGLNSFSAVNNVWGEFTVTSASVFSTLDVTYIPLASGPTNTASGWPIKIDIWESHEAARTSGPKVHADANTCYFAESNNGYSPAENCNGQWGAMVGCQGSIYSLITFLPASS